jgi:hypothetical protein
MKATSTFNLEALATPGLKWSVALLGGTNYKGEHKSENIGVKLKKVPLHL